MKRTIAWIGLVLVLIAAIAIGVMMNRKNSGTMEVNRTNVNVTNQVTNTPSTTAATLLLNELEERHLSSTEAADIISSVSSTTVYTSGIAEELGGIDCGVSTRHDQLVALNSGQKTYWVANDGLRITATPNTFNWTDADVKLFAQDETVVCGVGTTLPRVIVGDRILWWNVCVGGVGAPIKSSSEYSTTVRCLQAKEVIDTHFGIVTE